MYAFGEIDKTSTIIKNNVVNYSQNLNTSSLGIQSIKIVSGSINTNYWNSLNVLFYTINILEKELEREVLNL